MIIALTLLAAALYVAATAVAHSAQTPLQSRAAAAVAAAAIVAHAATLNLGLGEGAWRLDFGAALSMFAWLCAAVLTASISRWPLRHLAPVVWPGAALSMVAALVIPEGEPAALPSSLGVRAHILSSLLAYAVLTLAALQAVFYAARSRELHHRDQARPQLTSVPLTTMESLMFGLIGIGFALLCLSIATGFLFVDNFMAQHLVHKAVLSIVACALFGALLVGRFTRGWRGQMALRWTLAAYASLVLAYFGSKLVLEQFLGEHWMG